VLKESSEADWEVSEPGISIKRVRGHKLRREDRVIVTDMTSRTNACLPSFQLPQYLSPVMTEYKGKKILQVKWVPSSRQLPSWLRSPS
jgi:hypothetical protein